MSNIYLSYQYIFVYVIHLCSVFYRFVFCFQIIIYENHQFCKEPQMQIRLYGYVTFTLFIKVLMVIKMHCPV